VCDRGYHFVILLIILVTSCFCYFSKSPVQQLKQGPVNPSSNVKKKLDGIEDEVHVVLPSLFGTC